MAASWSSWQPNQEWICYPANSGVYGYSSGGGGCGCGCSGSTSSLGVWGCADPYSYGSRFCSSYLPPPVPPPALESASSYSTLTIENADYVRALIARHIYPWSPWPEYNDAAQLHRLCQTPERLQAAIDVLKPVLEGGGLPAMRALYLVGALPTSSLPKLAGELGKLAKANSGLIPDGQFRALAEVFKNLAAKAKGEAAEEENKRKWEMWQSHYGRSRVAWLPPPDDSQYAYAKMPSVQSPKNPDGWRWVLMPGGFIGALEKAA